MQDTASTKFAHTIIDDYVTSGSLAIGDRLPSSRELQKKYATSGHTIVHALTHLEDQGILIKYPGKKGYFLAEVKDFNQAEPKFIGFIAPCTTDEEHVMRVYNGISGVCERNGYHVILANSSSNYKKERDHVKNMISAGCKAIVLFAVTRTRDQLENDYLKTKYPDFPIVMVDMAFPSQMRSQVVFDNYAAGYEMTSTLLKGCHRKIAFIQTNTPSGDFMHKSTQERYRGYQDALKNFGDEPLPECLWVVNWLLNEGPTDADIAAGLMPYVQSCREGSDHPTAIIALEDRMAYILTSMAVGLGIDVPGELTILGFDNLASTRLCNPIFDTTDPDFSQAGRMAADIAIQHIDEEVDHQVVCVLPVPILRRSGTPSLANLHLQQFSEINGR